MNYSEVLSTIELIIESKNVPLIIGESGIGKTSLARELAFNRNSELITIDANLLKEGEIGGLPIVKDGVTIYATHHKLSEINRILNKDNNQRVILFIDELNRCDHAVSQELMNLILNREINGYRLDDRVDVIAAMNPSNRDSGFEDSEYEVVDMDPAQQDRFVWVELDSDFKEWIKWGMSKRGNINNVVIEFLSSFPQYLHQPYNRESIKPTPRSWERISKAYDIYEKNKERYSLDTFINVVKGNVGISIANDFANFLVHLDKPLIKVEEIFENEILSADIKDRINKENHSRLYILAKNSLKYLEDNKSEKNAELFGQLLDCYPKDLRLGIMKEVKKDCKETVYEILLDNDMFLDAFFNIFK